MQKIRRGGRQKLPLVFTESGVAMLSSVLKSERALISTSFVSKVSSAFKDNWINDGIADSVYETHSDAVARACQNEKM